MHTIGGWWASSERRNVLVDLIVGFLLILAFPAFAFSGAVDLWSLQAPFMHTVPASRAAGPIRAPGKLYAAASTGEHSAGSHGRSAHRSGKGASSAHGRSAPNHASGVKRDRHGRISRSAKAKSDFKRTHPCPSTGKSSGNCPGYVIDHVVPLKRGGADAPGNMQWQTVEAAKIKDKTE